jgi:tRNA modification GTPase
MARAEAAVDYGEEEGIALNTNEMALDLEPLRARFHVEQARFRAARHLREGLRLALVGRPNAGKSTLFNALAGEDRAIVTDIPGTTRDVLELRCEWRGLPLRLFDTAGVRHTEDPLERLGVARVGPVLEAADLILHLIPAGDGALDPALQAALAPFAAKTQALHTFGDRAKAPGPAICAPTGDLDALEALLRERLLGGLAPDACLGALATDRQGELLGALIQQLTLLCALEPQGPPELPASLLQGAWGLLARLTGEDRAESTLDALFQGFCLGK